MSDNINNHSIKPNSLLINGHEYVGLEVQKVMVGVEDPSQREILTDKDTGLNYSRNLVRAQEVYNLRAGKHSPWFILDLATGQYGWYPGCEIHGNIIEGLEVPIKEAPSEESATISLISNASVVILDIDTLDQEPEHKGWYKILYTKEGYIKKDFITNLRYADPNGI